VVQKSSRHPIIYSGGVGSLDDLRELQAAGAGGIIVGKALYEGRFDLRAALAL
jgi:phosphoribosylformimino-5-aminoimidazole carboxamide ribotide isomerase